jgi:hypothetical protein
MPGVKSLSVSKFINKAVKDSNFRKKYFGNLDKLLVDYNMGASDMAKIKKLDLNKVSKQIATLKSLDLIAGDLSPFATHTKDSHTSHSKDAHSNDAHSNSSGAEAAGRLDLLVNRLREHDLTIIPRGLTTKVDIG